MVENLDTLSFNRNKFVGFEKKDDNTYLIFGTLEDNLYAHEIEFEVNISEMIITKINGVMRRYTTPLCPPAVELLKKAEGLKIEQGVTSKIKREISRPGCRHFGNLLNECINSIVPAILTSEWREMKDNNIELSREEFIKKVMQKYPQIKNFCSILTGSPIN